MPDQTPMDDTIPTETHTETRTPRPANAPRGEHRYNRLAVRPPLQPDHWEFFGPLVDREGRLPLDLLSAYGPGREGAERALDAIEFHALTLGVNMVPAATNAVWCSADASEKLDGMLAELNAALARAAYARVTAAMRQQRGA